MNGSEALDFRPQQQMLVYIDNNFKFESTEEADDIIISTIDTDYIEHHPIMESLIKDISLISRLIYKRTLLTKKCIDLMIENLTILSESDNKEFILNNINIRHISREYSNKINNIYSNYGLDKKSLFDNIENSIKIYCSMYDTIPTDIKDKLLEELDNLSAHIGIILFTYGRQGKVFNNLYKYYYELGVEKHRELYDQFTIIISWMKYMHKSANYYSEDLRAICEYIENT